MRNKRQAQKRARRQHGLQLVEMAFLMPIMILLMACIGEFGRYFHMRSTLLRATATGVNYMSDKANTSTELLAAQRMTVCGKATASCAAGEAIYPGFAVGNVTVTITGDAIAGKYVTVATTGINYAPVFKMTALSGHRGRAWGMIPMNVKTKMQYIGG